MKVKSGLRKFRMATSLILLALVVIIAFQNVRSTEIDILWWKANIPLVVLLLAIAVASAIITFLWTLWGNRS